MEIKSKFIRVDQNTNLHTSICRYKRAYFGATDNSHLKALGNPFDILGIMHGHGSHKTDSSAEGNILKEASSSKHLLLCF